MTEAEAKLNWPGFGKACNRCGWCCIAEQCRISVDLFGERDRCPALVATGDTFACDLVMDAGYPTASRVIGEMLGIGRGCDASDDE